MNKSYTIRHVAEILGITPVYLHNIVRRRTIPLATTGHRGRGGEHRLGVMSVLAIVVACVLQRTPLRAADKRAACRFVLGMAEQEIRPSVSNSRRQLVLISGEQPKMFSQEEAENRKSSTRSAVVVDIGGTYTRLTEMLARKRPKPRRKKLLCGI
jgi:hypothetical protein